MKVVIFCGGQGMRMRDFSERVPKPLVPVGPRPILWHMMKYYAHFGHDDFILCLGYGDRQIKEYFLEYKEWLSNDFVMTKGGEDVQLLNTDLDSWRITFVNTGSTARSVNACGAYATISMASTRSCATTPTVSPTSTCPR